VNVKHLVSVERWTCAIAAIVIASAILVLGRAAAFGVCLGAALMVLNAWTLRRIAERAFRNFKRPSAAILLFNLKMAALVGLVFVAIRYLHVDPISFVIGISVFPVAVVAAAIQYALRPDEESEHEETHG
jgi:hypothetical protein